MPIRKVSGGYKWGSHGKVYKNRQGAVRQAMAAYANGYRGEGVEITENIKDIAPRKLSSVPGLKYTVSHVGGNKYFGLQHEGSGKYLVKSMHVEKIKPTVDLANHFFANYNFADTADNISKNASHLYPVIKSFRQEVDRIHQPVEEKPKLKSSTTNKKKKKK